MECPKCKKEMKLVKSERDGNLLYEMWKCEDCNTSVAVSTREGG